MAKIETDLPDRLQEAIVTLVRDGWYKDEGELVREAVRRFIESHPVDLMAKFVEEDVEWGLRGKD